MVFKLILKCIVFFLLLQLLSDVLTGIEESETINIKNEEPEETTVRLLTMLRVLKYDPGSDP